MDSQGIRIGSQKVRIALARASRRRSEKKKGGFWGEGEQSLMQVLLVGVEVLVSGKAW